MSTPVEESETVKSETSSGKGNEVEENSANVIEASYVECKEEDLVVYSDHEVEAFNKEAVVKFNVKPKSARQYLISKKMIQVCGRMMFYFFIL